MADTKKEASKKAVMDSKAVLDKANKEKTKIRYNDRVKLEITSDEAKHYRKGQIINPHPIMAEQLIKQGIAKQVK